MGRRSLEHEVVIQRPPPQTPFGPDGEPSLVGVFYASIDRPGGGEAISTSGVKARQEVRFTISVLEPTEIRSDDVLIWNGLDHNIVSVTATERQRWIEIKAVRNGN